jgi:hypothetical protein
MNNLKHTPGSWHVDGHNLTAVISKINEHHYKHICTCDYGYSHPEEHFELNKANAKLIAAAPELLEACQLMLKAIDAAPAEWIMTEEVNSAMIHIQRAVFIATDQQQQWRIK